jgi:glucose/arabinose dehydrogenase
VHRRLFNPWSIAFLPDGRILAIETSGGLRLLDTAGRPQWYITGLPIFSKRAQQPLDVVPDKDFARTRIIFFLYRVPPKEAGDIGTREEDFRFITLKSKWSAAAGCRPMTRA